MCNLDVDVVSQQFWRNLNMRKRQSLCVFLRANWIWEIFLCAICNQCIFGTFCWMDSRNFFKTVDSKQMFNINFVIDCIRTTDLWCRKRPLYQLIHNTSWCSRLIISEYFWIKSSVVVPDSVSFVSVITNIKTTIQNPIRPIVT